MDIDGVALQLVVLLTILGCMVLALFDTHAGWLVAAVALAVLESLRKQVVEFKSEWVKAQQQKEQV